MGEFNRAFERSGLPEDQRDAFRDGWNWRIQLDRERRGIDRLPGEKSASRGRGWALLGLLTFMIGGTILGLYGSFIGQDVPNLRPWPVPVIGSICLLCVSFFAWRRWWAAASEADRKWKDRWS